LIQNPEVSSKLLVLKSIYDGLEWNISINFSENIDG
jgi:hypothetical protein